MVAHTTRAVGRGRSRLGRRLATLVLRDDIIVVLTHHSPLQDGAGGRTITTRSVGTARRNGVPLVRQTWTRSEAVARRGVWYL